MIAYALTDVGRRRETNQDHVFSQTTPVGTLPNLFVVADGMGGHKAGEYASEQAIAYVLESAKADTGENPTGVMNRAIQAANAKLFEESRLEAFQGMGTTLVMACVAGDTLYVANVGDSRLYVVNGDICQVSRDHSLVEELVAKGELERGSQDYYEQKNIITRAVGIKGKVRADFFEVELQRGDVILLCSDGLTNMVSDERIARIIETSASLSTMAHALVDEANKNGGKDNISVVLIKPEIETR